MMVTWQIGTLKKNGTAFNLMFLNWKNSIHLAALWTCRMSSSKHCEYSSLVDHHEWLLNANIGALLNQMQSISNDSHLTQMTQIRLTDGTNASLTSLDQRDTMRKNMHGVTSTQTLSIRQSISLDIFSFRFSNKFRTSYEERCKLMFSD
jgi:hypothetical protein